MAHKAKNRFTGRRKGEEHREITVRHEGVDGSKGFKKHISLKHAQKDAQSWVGEHPEIDSTGHAIAPDGVVKVSVTGATLDEIFPAVREQVHGTGSGAEDEEHDASGGDQGPVEHTGTDAGPNGDREGVVAGSDEAAGSGENEGGDEDEDAGPKSVVAKKFKLRYAAHARELGVKGKAAKRSNWDWLAQQIAEQCLSPKAKIDIERFKDLLDANGVDHSKWTNRSTGWEGRLRMTGRVALQRIVADAKMLKLVDETTLVPPDEFIEKYKTKA